MQGRLKPVLAAASAGVLACYLAGLGYGAAQSPVPDNKQAVIPWLEAHHLTSGLGTYAEANLLTLDSGGRLAIRDVAWYSGGDLPRSFETKTSWYDPRHSYANFILTNSADQWGMDGGGPHTLASMIPASAIAALHAGPPAHVYHYKTFTIMVWNHNLLDNLGKTPGILPGEVPCLATAFSRWPVSCSVEGCGKGSAVAGPRKVDPNERADLVRVNLALSMTCWSATTTSAYAASPRRSTHRTDLPTGYAG